MGAPTPLPKTNIYAVRLLAADPMHPGPIAGRLEHVLSGRCHDFVDGPALLAWLALEQLQAAQAPPRDAGARDGRHGDGPATDARPAAEP